MTRIALIAIVLLAGFLTTIPSYAQENFIPGYIVNLSNDSIQGLIDYRNWSVNPRSIAFKAEQEEQVINYSTSDLNGFGVENDRYVSRTVSVDVSPYRIDELDHTPSPDNRTDQVFLQVLVAGEKSLYYLKEEDLKPHFYIGQDENCEALVFKKYLKSSEGVDHLLSNERFKGQLILYFEDCPAIQGKVNNARYLDKDLCRVCCDLLIP